MKWYLPIRLSISNGKSERQKKAKTDILKNPEFCEERKNTGK